MAITEARNKIDALVEKAFSLEKVISDSSLDDLEAWFGIDEDELDAMDEEHLSAIFGIMDRVDKIGDSVTYSIQNMDEMEAAIASGGEYMVWKTSQDELVCGFCGPLDNKIVLIAEIDSLGITPPAHVNCRCEIITIEERYGELKPVQYYHSIPTDYEGWRTSGAVQIETEMVDVK